MGQGDNAFGAEAPENFEQKTICCFAIDTSGSMAGSPIAELNRGLQEFYKEISDDSIAANRLEVGMVTFDSEVNTLLSPSLVDGFSMPTLSAKGTTKLVDGAREAIRLVEDRKNWYKSTGQPYLRPWVILITDGAPDGDQDVDGLSTEIEQKTKDKKLMFMSIGVQGANMAVLDSLSGYIKDQESGELTKVPPMKLDGLKFFEFFRWLSESLGGGGIAGSSPDDSINLPDPSNWMTGFKI